MQLLVARIDRFQGLQIRLLLQLKQLEYALGFVLGVSLAPEDAQHLEAEHRRVLVKVQGRIDDLLDVLIGKRLLPLLTRHLVVIQIWEAE